MAATQILFSTWPVVRKAALLGAVLLTVTPSVFGATATQPCRIAGFRTELQCGSVARPLDPARPQGVQIEVHYIVVPALARRKLDDPVFFLAGGPGQSAIGVLPMVAPQLNRLNNRRDLVFVDQRGTGRSAPLMCPDHRRDPLSLQLDEQHQRHLLRQCLGNLQALPYGDLRYFTTTLAMQDLDAVRASLGASRVNLIGVSYGTRAALEYLRQFPQHVRRVVLDSVAPPDMVLPESISGDNHAALDGVLAACELEPTCAKAYPRLRSDWAALLRSLPKTVEVQHPATGTAERVTITRDAVLGAVRAPLYVPALASGLPLALTQAAQGRFEGLLGLSTLLGTGGKNRLAEGMHFSVLCSEDAPRMTKSLPTSQTDFGTAFPQLYRDICADWPRGAVPDAFYNVPSSVVPVLVLSGGRDPVTPPRHGERVVKALGAQAQHVVVPNTGHSLMAMGCLRDVVFRFVSSADAVTFSQPELACATAVPVPHAYRPLATGPKGQP